jgi:hypothetical protein
VGAMTGGPTCRRATGRSRTDDHSITNRELYH